MKARSIVTYISAQHKRRSGRIIVLTGARQTGKTTLCRELFTDMTFISLEDPVLRDAYRSLTAAEWANRYPYAILDEIQKEPRLVESIKAVYDQWTEPRYILTGSSQLLLLEKVRESLAGRCTIVELFPLTLPELRTHSFVEVPEPSIFIQALSKPEGFVPEPSSFLLDPHRTVKTKAWDHYYRFGAYPALVHEDMDGEERKDWLRNYVNTYLERDIRDLASFRDLDAFVKLQRWLALQTAMVLNYQELATQLGLSSKTVQRYIRYFDLSYQALILPAWARNTHKRLTKAPKLHYLDVGVLRGVLQKWGDLSGFEFESLVIAEMYKQIKNGRLDASLYHLRTQDGREVDLLIELPSGYLAFEIKMAERVSQKDARHLRILDGILDKKLIHSFLVSNDPSCRPLDTNITAIHAAAFLA